MSEEERVESGRRARTEKGRPMEEQKRSPAIGWTEAELDLTTLEEEALPSDHRSGFVAVVGRPNVGKSTLLNAFLGQKIAIVSPKPQTTRLRQLGILTTPDFQIVFLDTPGWHTPHHKLGEYMLETAARAIHDADVVLFVVDLSEPPTSEDHLLTEFIHRRQERTPVIMALNKMDLLESSALSARCQMFVELLPNAGWVALSATLGDHRDRLLNMIVATLPNGPRYYPADQITDSQVRQLVGELVREQALNHLRHEVPHAIAVVVEEFKERNQNLTFIRATIFVEKDSQKGILIGSRGNMLKKIGAAAREEIESVLGIRIYLDLWVKVRPKWRKRERSLRQFGYYQPRG